MPEHRSYVETLKPPTQSKKRKPQAGSYRMACHDCSDVSQPSESAGAIHFVCEVHRLQQH